MTGMFDSLSMIQVPIMSPKPRDSNKSDEYSRTFATDPCASHSAIV